MPKTSKVLGEEYSSPPPIRLAFGLNAAAAALGISPRKLHALTAKRLIPHVRIGRRLVFPVADLQRWLSDQAAKGANP